MQVEFKDRVSAQDKEHYRCNTAEQLQPVHSPTAIIYASIHAHVFMNKPDLECTSCGTRILVYPVSIGCISVTPRQATMWYDQ